MAGIRDYLGWLCSANMARAMALILATSAGAGAWAETATGSAQPAAPATSRNCEEHQVYVDGDSKAVATVLPRAYTPVTDPTTGDPVIFARAQHCGSFAAGAESGTATVANWGVLIKSPDGQGCVSGVPVIGQIHGDLLPACNWYTVSYVANDQRVVDWLARLTPDLPATHVGNLVFRDGARNTSGTPFHFEAPAPSPSQFSIDDVGTDRPGALPVRGGYYYSTAEGAVRVDFATDDLSAGRVESTLRAAPGSRLAQLMGATKRHGLEPYAEVGWVHWGQGIYRKQLLGPPLPREHIDSFAGSCSFKGDVTFDPPATNTQANTAYTYMATGTCRGTVKSSQRNGSVVLNDSPVSLQQSGRSYAACSQAHTLEPGTGTLTFPNGLSLPFNLDFADLGTQVDFSFYGTRSGMARGQGSFLTLRTPPSVVTNCASTGDAKVPMDLSLTANQPLVSSYLAPAPVASRQLQLAVSPRRTRAGHRTRFAFRVTTTHHHPVGGATIDFAGHRLRTSSRGLVAFITTFERPRRHIVRAHKRGFRPAAAAVDVQGR